MNEAAPSGHLDPWADNGSGRHAGLPSKDDKGHGDGKFQIVRRAVKASVMDRG